MASKKSKKYLIGLSLAALIPISFFLIIRSLSDGRVKIPKHYRPEAVDSALVKGKMQYDTLYHKVKELTLTNQLDRKVSLNKDLRGKMLVVNFIFTSCPTVCPQLTHNMSLVQKAFIKKNPDLVQFISISVDPWRDSVKVLRDFADRYNADHDRWWFLTGDADQIFDYARNELGLTLQPSDAAKGMYDHSDKFVLIDTARNIRGYYNGMDMMALKAIADDVVILSMEKK